MSISILRKVSWLKGLPEPVLKRVLGAARPRSCQAGEVLFSKSQDADGVFIVASGRIKIHSQSAARKRKTFAYLGPGDFFGEMAVLEDKARSASATASDAARLLVISKKNFEKLLLSDAHLCYNLLRSVSARLRRANEEIESLLFRNVLGRVSKTLCELAAHGDGRGLGQKLTQQELADLVGTTREPLARALAKLRQARLIETSGGAVVIVDPERLSAMAAACGG